MIILPSPVSRSRSSPFGSQSSRGLFPAILAIVLLSLWLSLFPSTGQSQIGARTSHVGRDVPVFVSSKESLYGDLKYELMEDLRIGSESDPQKLFYTVTAGN